MVSNFLHTLDRGKVYIHDELPRDGRQKVVRKNEALHANGKLEAVPRYVEHLARLGVPFIDVGVPAAGGIDVDLAKSFAESCHNRKEMCLTGFVRSIPREIDLTLEVLARARNRGVSILTSPSLPHAVKFGSVEGKPVDQIRAEMEEKYVAAVAHAGELLRDGVCHRVHVYVEDATRMSSDEEREYLAKLLARYIEAGATDISLPDTMGLVRREQEYVDMFRDVQARLGPSFVERVFWSAHCHADFECGLKNSMAALEAGVVQIIEGTFGGRGPGEGVGNTDLNLVVDQLVTQPDFQPRSSIQDASALLQANQDGAIILGRMIPHDAPIVGEEAGRLTAAGIHQDALYKVFRELKEVDQRLLKKPDDYDLLKRKAELEEGLLVYTHDFSMYGVTNRRLFAINTLSGRNGLRGAFEERDIIYLDETIPDALEIAHRIAKIQNHRLTDEQLESLAYAYRIPPESRPLVCDFETFEVSKKGGDTTVSFDIEYLGSPRSLTATVNDGSAVSAFTKALDNFFSEREITISSRYSVRADFHGEEHERPSQVEVMVDAIVGAGSRHYTGIAFDTDQDQAGCEAVLLGVNQWLTKELERIED